MTHPTSRIVHDELGSGVVHDDEGATLQFTDALVRSTLGEVDDAVRREGGYGRLLSPEVAPDWALGWIGAFTGVRWDAGLSAEQMRERLVDRPQQQRGTLGAIYTAVRRTLSHGQTVRIFERETADGDPHPYHYTVVTFISETPNPQITERVVQETKPMGLIAHYRLLEGATYAQLSERFHTYAELSEAFDTYEDMRMFIPDVDPVPPVQLIPAPNDRIGQEHQWRIERPTTTHETVTDSGHSYGGAAIRITMDEGNGKLGGRVHSRLGHGRCRR